MQSLTTAQCEQSMNQAFDELDREILNRIQAEVPLAERPFQVLGREFGLSEAEMLSRLRRMWDLGIVRRLGPIINYPAWGMSGILVAAQIDPGRLEEAQTCIGSIPEITHAYLREAEWNFWFTVIAENEDKRDAIIDKVSREAGLTRVEKLPLKKSFKLEVKFEI